MEYFNNEYDKGKLYISYPMVEALRDMEELKYESIDSTNHYWNIINNKNYKSYASNKIKKISFLSVYKDYTLDIWSNINKFTWRKANFLIHKKTELPSYDDLMEFTQEKIYLEQLKLMNSSGNENIKNIVVLSAFPFFISNYLRRELIEKMICNCSCNESN